MSSLPFKFKEFTVHQDRCAMKIGTDGVLLGAWTSVDKNPFSVLDIGAGTGVLALMIAQRSYAENIEALEIDADAYEQCSENFENSPWADRLFCYHASLLEFVEEIEDTYDLIICNPPFYTEDYKTDNDARDLARFNDAMPFDHLIYAVANLLSNDGVFTVVIPSKEEIKFTDLALKAGLHLNRSLHVKGNPEADVKRSLLEYSFHNSEIEHSELIIETARHQYTEDYINLTKDFYLKM
ncbi:tRNA1(Val) (adenine(37)-N6)-methyltransferase [Winogradskyella thalassocola]|uniref:tRNA1(Val) (adenine(37)-N6)-methyltransferase n=1 Tax=Winogradskyella thalassocola TaxID=262004 RepID=A0A1G7Y0F7_9FLAO|nr:methyltransferase [Winogradskyella thalassocola]SDG89874.1 tRNA1Val (adenine37-N6)-methyltransferase [Winogradskyella thalassocola]